MRRLGLDIGSRTIKLVELSSQGAVVFTKCWDTLEFYHQFGIKTDQGFSIDIEQLGIKSSDHLAVTGYGKHTTSLDMPIKLSEHKAHMLGAIHQLGLQQFTLLDIGGQDTKVIEVEQGKIQDIIMNDKCAASSGRFLETMAQALKIPLDEMGSHLDDPISISTTCAVFGESEVLSHVFRGVPVNSILAGINVSLVQRLLKDLRSQADFPIVFVGGVAKNKAIQQILADRTSRKVSVPKWPQLNGAIGAATCN